MGRNSSGAYILDDLKTLSIADLKRLGYLKQGCRYGNVRWTYRGEPTGTVSITVSLWPEYGWIAFSYTYDHQHQYRYHLQMVSVPANLGIGRCWFFVCTRTGKRCTKLYLANGYFQHRDGIKGAMYRSQTRSHFSRAFDRVMDAEDGLYTRHMKWHYRGKPTPRYLRAKAARQTAARYVPEVLRRLSK